MDTNSLSPVDRFNNWVKESVMLKLASIGFLILILLIPASWIESLINERQSRADDVVREISDKWSGMQTLTGPVLMIPFTKIEKLKRWEKGVAIEERLESVHRAYFLPEELTVDSKLAPQVLHRGIFDAVVYDSKINCTAKFAELNFQKWNIPDEQVHWKEAQLVTGISDMRGISENPVIRSGEKVLITEPSSDVGLTENSSESTEIVKGIASSLEWNSRADVMSNFSIALNLKGSERLYFIPVGKTSEVKISGNWGSPSFDGKLLPATRTVNENDFSAMWKVLSYNRPFSQQWLNNEQSLGGSEFGVRLLIPADQYQKSIRSAKYGALIIILAFTALFLVEITAKIRIHPFQYILIGAALIIYYTLLLSFSEHIGYNAGYAIASLATVTLLALYSTTFLVKRSLVVLFTLLMSIFYTFIFVIIQAQDYSLLIGSIGLFLIISVIMFFSRNIKWYKETESVS
jgi:inner membrane protein